MLVLSSPRIQVNDGDDEVWEKPGLDVSQRDLTVALHQKSFLDVSSEEGQHDVKGPVEDLSININTKWIGSSKRNIDILPGSVKPFKSG